MAERRRGTQGRPMIYGKSPESRRYWNIEPEDGGAPEENLAQSEKKGTGKAPENRETENQKTVQKDKKHMDSMKTERRPGTDRQDDLKSAENKKNAGGRLHLHRKTNPEGETERAARSVKMQRPKAKAEKPVSGEHRRKRARSYGEQTKLRALWTVFGVLCVLLVAAIIYEIVLGNGTKLPGSERITQPTRQEQNKVTTGITLQKNQTEAVQTETAAPAETEVQTKAAAQTGETQTETESMQTGEASGTA